ncbi:MAG: hypothetical protein ACFCUG_15435 [Thiotrichales bacterium]
MFKGGANLNQRQIEDGQAAMYERYCPDFETGFKIAEIRAK